MEAHPDTLTSQYHSLQPRCPRHLRSCIQHTQRRISGTAVH